uniref:Conjugal transfer protein TrbL n=1 Tax=Enterovibrio norvegicus TaxID=188144 RepID=A0A0H3ZW79_9GAMM|nr:hypothetical protein [Enterovibrio norvegicus]
MNEYDIREIINASATIGDALSNYFDYVVFDLIAGRYPALNKALHTLITSILLITCLVRGVLSMTGKANIQLREVGFTSFWVLVATSITEPSTYNYYVIETVTKLTTNLGSFFVGDFSGASTFEQVENTVFRMFKMIWLITENLDTWDWIEILTLYFLGAIYGALYVMFIIIIAYSKFGTSIMLLLGGLIINLAAFKSFRGMAKSWIQSICKYALCVTVATLIIVLSMQLCAVILDLFIEQTGGSDTPDDISDYFGVFFWLMVAAGIVGLFLMTKAIELTSEITGGVATDMSQSANAAANAANASLTPIRMIASGAGKAIKGKFGG